jgi:hypothetical protein
MESFARIDKIGGSPQGIVILRLSTRERAGISDKDTNAPPGVVKLITYGTFRAFLASLKKRELRSPGPRIETVAF